jgi:hypothetical protein
MNQEIDKSQDIIECPHCHQYVIILELNCKIFRHGTYKSTGEQIPPHSPKDICDSLVETDQIYGCGKPFLINVLENGEWCVEICDYI